MICTVPDCQEHYACGLRAKGIQVNPIAVTPNRHALRRDPGVRKPNCSWEKGIVYDERPDGSRMPLFAPGTRRPLRLKEYGENRRQIDEQVRRLKTTDTPLKEMT